MESEEYMCEMHRAANGGVGFIDAFAHVCAAAIGLGGNHVS